MRVLEGVKAALPLLALFAVLLLGPAAWLRDGGWRWPQAWIVLGLMAAIYGGGSVFLALRRPASFEVRQQGIVAPKARKQPLIDAVGSVLFFAYLIGWMTLIPLDAFALRLLPTPPVSARLVGLAGCALGLATAQLAVMQNRFAAPTVQDQSAAGQHVVDRGLYGLVRHPLYAGNLLTFSGMALWLGSYAALVGVAGILAFTIARIVVEEGYLRANLAGYADYMRRVRARLIPFVV